MSTLFVVLLALGSVSTLGLMVVEHRGATRLKPVLKMSAATAFVVMGLTGRLDQVAAVATMVGLGFGWLGDAALLSRKKPIFLLGIGAFLLGHLAYVVAWMTTSAGEALFEPVSWFFLALAVVTTALLWRWVEGGMRAAVVAYILTITVMGVVSVARWRLEGDARFVIGAVMFALSDVSVALDRFTPLPRHHRWAGIPLYFGAQYVIASTIAG